MLPWMGGRYSFFTMKTATMRDLRNHFAAVAKWIERGEVVTITRNGAAFATLAPVGSPCGLAKSVFAARYKDFKPLSKRVAKEATEKLWADLRG